MKRLRGTLLRVLASDSDLEAFCLDCFPSVQKRFSAGMDRQTKLNLLLQQVPKEELTATLARYVPGEFAQEIESITAGALELAPFRVLRSAPERGTVARTGRVLLGALLWMGLGLGLGWAVASRRAAPQPQPDSYRAKGTGAASSVPPVASLGTTTGNSKPMQTATHAVVPPSTQPSTLPEIQRVSANRSSRSVHTHMKERAHDPIPEESYVPPPIEE